MTHDYHTTFRMEYQGFICENSEKFEGNRRILAFHSNRTAKEVYCPQCSGTVIGHGIRKVRLTDIPYEPGFPSIYEVFQHRYLCKNCGKIFTEQNPFKVPGFSLTKRCVLWIFKLLQYKFPTSAIASFFGLEWNTVRKLEKMRIDYILKERDEEICGSDYRPYFLAVDEFAIRKGVPALAKFGRQKRRCIEGLIAHAKHPINTGRLEGFNNKIKVAKRNAFGFRYFNFFFAYIRYLSIPNGDT